MHKVCLSVEANQNLVCAKSMKTQQLTLDLMLCCCIERQAPQFEYPIEYVKLRFLVQLEHDL